MKKVKFLDKLISAILKKIENIMDKEMSKSVEKMNGDIVELCLDILIKRRA